MKVLLAGIGILAMLCHRQGKSRWPQLPRPFFRACSFLWD